MLAGGIDALMRTEAAWPTTLVGFKNTRVLYDLPLCRSCVPHANFVFVVRHPRA
jgi:hypothetical protein